MASRFRRGPASDRIARPHSGRNRRGGAMWRGSGSLRHGDAMEQYSDGLPLSGITVLDLTLARAGPTCVRHLADWGANVIRIEPPATGGEDAAGNRHGFDFQNLHRNKR